MITVSANWYCLRLLGVCKRTQVSLRMPDKKTALSSRRSVFSLLQLSIASALGGSRIISRNNCFDYLMMEYGKL